MIGNVGNVDFVGIVDIDGIVNIVDIIGIVGFVDIFIGPRCTWTWNPLADKDTNSIPTDNGNPRQCGNASDSIPLCLWQCLPMLLLLALLTPLAMF